MAAAVCAMALTGADAFAPASPVGGRAGIVRETRALRPAALAQGAPRTCRACPPVSMAAAGTEAPWKIVKNTAARTAFVLNQWKNVAENSRSLGWTSSSEEAMMKLRREAATADAMKAVIPALMKRATLDKAIAEVGKAPEGMPDEITNLGVTLAVSVGAGSACALYYKCPEKKFWCIEQLVANTAMAGQLESQVHVIQEIAKDAKEEGVPEVRMASCCYDEMKGTIYGSLEELGFQQPEADVAWSVYKQ
eukprot:Tamp_27925.p2 GENE.Tamp_27925~~Tamp_27925.p2  ORF type:complete len:250 (-),score=65.32 Tamp_27925:86-835(-)